MSTWRYFVVVTAWLLIVIGGIWTSHFITGAAGILLGLLVGWDLFPVAIKLTARKS